MARTRNLQVVISGDAKGLNRAFGQIDKGAKQTEGRLQRFGKVSSAAFAGLGIAAGGAAVVGLKKSADAAIEAEKSQARLQAQLKASGISYRDHAKAIDSAIQKTSKLSGLDDEDLQDSFTNIVRVTGDVNKSLRLTGLAADFARAKHIDVAKAGEIVGKVAGGNIGVLSRYGIQIDKGASSSEALAKLQAKFAGQAEAYGKTTAGSMDRAGVASENLGEIVGAKLTPLLAKGATALVSLIDKSGRLAGPIRESTGAVRDAYDKVAGAVGRFVDKNRTSINDVIRAARRLGDGFKAVFLDVVVPVARRVGELVGRYLLRVARVLGDVVGIIVALINGDWRKAWKKAGDLVKDFVGGIVGTIKDVGGLIWAAVTGLGKLIVRGIVKGMGNLGHVILDKVKDAAGFVGGALSKLNPFGDGVGKILGDGAGKVLSTITPGPIPGGGMGEGLMGAQQALAPLAAVGSRFGLRVSSGRRAGSITSSGNISYHSTGEAIDEAGSPSGMLNFFRYMKAKFGPRLAELIYTPGGVGIKNGRPHRYTGAVAADHYDHVHVALDTGVAGVGDGSGMSAADAARRAGFKGSSLVTALAVADAESGFNPRAQNLKYPDHSIGLWQINQLAHHGKYGSDGVLKSPLANAKAAWAISGGGRNWSPWTTFTSGAYKRYLGVARKLALGTRGGGSSSGGGMPFKVVGSSAQGAGSIGVGRGAGFIPGMGSVSGTGEFTEYGGGFTADAGMASGEAGSSADAPAEYSPIGAYSGLIDLINARERAGVYSASEAKGHRIYQANRFLAGDLTQGGAANISESERLGVMGDLREFTDATDSLTEAINAQTEATKRLTDLQAEQNSNQLKILAMVSQGPEILAAVVAAVSGGIGGKAGLGFQSVGVAGSVARY